MDWLSIIPPVIAIAVVLWRKEVIVSLVLAIFASELLQLAFAWHAPGTATINTVERIVGVFNSPDNARLLVFSLIIGALLAYLRVSGGVAAVVEFLVGRGIAKTPKQASLLTSAVGGAVFVESNLSVLTAGILSRGIFDRHGLSRAKLAYIIDSTSAPICILILLNAWGALVLVLIGQYDLGMTAPEVLWSTVPLNFYALVTLVIVFWSSWTQRWYGPLARSKAGVGLDVHLEEHIEPSKPRFMIVPLVSTLDGMGDDMIEAGYNLGGNSLTVLRRIIIPYAMPGIVSGCIVVFMLTAGSYLTPILLGGKNSSWFTEQIYDQFITRFNWESGAAFGFILLMFTSLVVWLGLKLSGQTLSNTMART